jgi:hypothetical protein
MNHVIPAHVGIQSRGRISGRPCSGQGQILGARFGGRDALEQE